MRIRTLQPDLVEQALVRPICAAAMLSSALACLASYWVNTGTTPAGVYDWFGRLEQLTVKHTLVGLPLEFAGIVGFGASLLFSLGARPELQMSRFVMSVLLSAHWGFEAWDHRLVCLPADGNALSGIALLLASSRYEMPTLRTFAAGWFRLLRGLTTDPLRRCVALAVLCVPAVAGASLSWAINQPIGAIGDPNARNFERWFSSRVPLPHHGLRRSDGVRVVAFIDYQDPRSAFALRVLLSIVERASTNGRVPVDLILRDFPADPTCNPFTTAQSRDTACESAIAIRVVRTEKGNDAANELVRWLVGNGSKTTVKSIRDRLAEMALLEALQSSRERIQQDVTADTALGKDLGVHQTPTLFVNGVRTPFTFVEVAVRHAARRVRQSFANR